MGDGVGRPAPGRDAGDAGHGSGGRRVDVETQADGGHPHADFFALRTGHGLGGQAGRYHAGRGPRPRGVGELLRLR